MSTKILIVKPDQWLETVDYFIGFKIKIIRQGWVPLEGSPASFTNVINFVITLEEDINLVFETLYQIKINRHDLGNVPYSASIDNNSIIDSVLKRLDILPDKHDKEDSIQLTFENSRKEQIILQILNCLNVGLEWEEKWTKNLES